MNALKVPSLRFPEFSGEWEEKKLGDITCWASGGTPPKDDPLFWGGDIPWISASSMRGLAYSESDHKITLEGLKKGSKLAKKGSLLLLVRGSMLFNTIPIGIALKDVAFNQDVKSIEVSELSTSKYVLYWFISSESKILNMVTGTGIGAGKLDLSELKGLEIYLPSLPEQTKIATFLSSVDSKIDQLSQKKTLLEQYKKGVMQQIFSQHIRFKADDGSDYPEWEEKKLGEVGTTYNGLTGKTADDFGDGFPYIQYKQIFDKSKIDISKFGFVSIGANDKQNMVCYGDIFFTISSETPNEVGYASVLLDDVDNLYLNSFCFGYRPNKLLLDSSFSQYLFRSNKFRKKVIPLAQGSTRYNISKTEFIKLTVMLPCLEEQTKIANFLSAIDSKIEQVAQQLDQAKQFKKGLLQQMFV